MCPIWRNWYRNEVDEKIKGVNFRDNVKHNQRRVWRLGSCANFVCKCAESVFDAFSDSEPVDRA